MTFLFSVCLRKHLNLNALHNVPNVDDVLLAFKILKMIKSSLNSCAICTHELDPYPRRLLIKYTFLLLFIHELTTATRKRSIR